MNIPRSSIPSWVPLILLLVAIGCQNQEGRTHISYRLASPPEVNSPFGIRHGKDAPNYAHAQVHRGTELPIPPLQHMPWEPPPGAALDPAQLGEIRDLFDAGLPDPRGLPFGTAWVARGNVWSGWSGETQVNGWLFPSQDGQWYLIDWVGMIHRAVPTSFAESLDAEVAYRAQLGVVSEYSLLYPEWPDMCETRAWEGSHVGCALLLRLGRSDLWADLRKAVPFEEGRAHLDVVWAHTERARCALMSGLDDQVAADTDFVLRFVSASGFIRSPGDDVHRLSEDSLRRRTRKRNPHPNLALLSIPELIDYLDELSVRQEGQPGSVKFNSAMLSHELLRRGSEAIPALLACVETDRRLTRSVGFWRDFSTSRTLHTVSTPAYEILQAMLEVPFFSPDSTSDSLSIRSQADAVALVGQMRHHLHRYGETPGAPRAFRMLSEDDNPEAWALALPILKSLLIQPEGRSYSPVFYSTWHDTNRFSEWTEAKRRAARPFASPIQALLERRLGELEEKAKQGGTDSLELILAMRRILPEWSAQVPGKEGR